MQRPTGITILAILAIIGGALVLLGSIALFLIGAALAAGTVKTGTTTTTLTAGTAFTTGAVALVLGVLEIVWGIGALRLRPWAWTLGIVLGVLNILSLVVNVVLGQGVSPRDVISVIISVLIIAYLFSPRVRQAFGRA